VESERRQGALRAAFRHRDFRFLVSGQAITQTGDWLYNVALIAYVLDQTGSGAWVAATTFIRFLPYVVLGPLGGVIVDRYDRKVIMIVTDLARAGVMAILAVAAGLEAPAIVAIALATVSTTLSTPYFACVSAATPALVGEEDLTAANAIISTIANLTLALGPALGGLLLLLGPSSTAFAVNGATFVVSAVFTALIRTHLSPPSQEAQEDRQVGRPQLRERLSEGLRAITSSKEVLLLMGVSIAFMVFYGQEIVLYSLAATERLGLGDSGIGYLFAATGVGGILAAFFTGRLSDRSRQGLVLAIAVIVTPIPMILLAFVTEPIVAYALLLVEGVGFVVGDIVSMTMLQRILPGNVLGRVLGLMDSLMVIGILAGSVMAAMVVRGVGLSGGLVVAGALVVIAGLAVLPAARGIDRKTVERFERLRPRVDFLMQTSLLEGAPRPVVEGLADSANEERIHAGSVVIREGGEPESLYVVIHGRLEVVSTGEGATAEPTSIGELGAGDYFGEIGLIERIPRTATVRAIEDCELLRISGQDFLRFATEGTGLMTALRAGIATRLAKTHPTRTARHPGR
jgi:predicted MFS family arabinose efflux permease